MVNLRRKLDGAIKAKIVVESLKGEKTIPELGSSYGVHPKMIQLWKRRALEGLPSLFSEKVNRAEREQGELIDELYKQIGQLKVELDWVKKKSGFVC